MRIICPADASMWALFRLFSTSLSQLWRLTNANHPWLDVCRWGCSDWSSHCLRYFSSRDLSITNDATATELSNQLAVVEVGFERFGAPLSGHLWFEISGTPTFLILRSGDFRDSIIYHIGRHWWCSMALAFRYYYASCRISGTRTSTGGYRTTEWSITRHSEIEIVSLDVSTVLNWRKRKIGKSEALALGGYTLLLKDI